MTSVRVPPATDDDWKRQMERDGLTGQTIHGQIFPSASKFTRKDFLTMRILRQPVKPDNFNFENFGLGQDLIRDAKKRLSRYKSWESYRNSFRKGKHPEEGSLFLVKLCQNETKGAETSEISSSISPKKTRSVTQQEETEKAGHRPQTPTTSSGMITGQEAYRQISEHIQWSEELSAEEVPLSPSSKDSSPLSEYISSEARRSRKTADEQIVNAALLNFLKAITEHFTDILHHWTIQRYPLHAVVNGVELYEARTDGCLSDGPGKFICSLIEVKAATRRDHVFEIFMQESAQIVAWILNQRDEYLKLPGRCFQVVQDHQEIYLNFAEFDNKYLQYIRGEEVHLDNNDPRTFMTIFEVGPFKTMKVTHMEKLAPIILALTLRADKDKQHMESGLEGNTLQGLSEEFNRKIGLGTKK